MRRPRSNSFVGRSADLDALAKRLTTARLVTILGPPGIGKTRLAERCLDLHAPRCGWFCDLADATSVDDICAAVGRALDIRVGAGESAAVTGQLGEALAGRGALLLLLDNFERAVTDAAATVGRWLGQAPNVRFLVTSRTRLCLSGEEVFDLGPLSLPADEAEAAASEAVQLFVERARAVCRGYALTEQEASRVAALVRYLDGNPLAIELAAARLRVLTTAELVESLSGSLGILGGNAVDAHHHHATLRDAVGWSWSALTPWEQSTLAQCAVFRGGFTVRAAAEVVRTPPGAPATLDVLQALCDRALLGRRDAREASRHARFVLHVGVREFAAEKLAERGERDAAEARHAAHYLAAARTAMDMTDGAGGLEAQGGLSVEVENLLAVHRRVLRRPERTVADVAAAMEIAVALHPVISMRGPAPLLLHLIDQALASPRAAEVGDALRARLLMARADTHRIVGHMEEFRRACEEAIALATRADDPRLIGGASVVLAYGLLLSGALAEADVAIGRALRVGLPVIEARSVGLTGVLRNLEGRPAEAVRALLSSMGLLRRTGDVAWEALMTMNVAAVQFESGDLEGASFHCEQGRALCDRLDNRLLRAAFVGLQARIAAARAHRDTAEGLYREAIRAMHETGARRAEGILLGYLGTLLEAMGRRREARGAYEGALPMVDGNCSMMATWARAGLGRLDAAEGRVVEALAHLTAAEAFAPADPRGAPILELARGHVDLARARASLAAGDTEAAASHRREARRRVDAVTMAEKVLDVRLAREALEHDLEAFAVESRPAALVVQGQGKWFCLGPGGRVDCRRRRVLARLLTALAEHRLAAPGATLPTDALVTKGWPGERMAPEAAELRLWVSVCRLRDLGLRDVLRSDAGGYLLDPQIPLTIAS